MKAIRTSPRALPILQGLLPFSAAELPTEIVAGITLAALTIPSVLGYSAIAGMPVVTGLYTVLAPTIVFALLGSSRHLVVGADSATAAILAAGLAGLAAAGSAQYVALAGACALLTGLMLLVARLFRLGFLADFLSRSVLIGFLSGVGIQVAIGQLPGMLGLHAAGHSTLESAIAIVSQIGKTSVSTLTVSACVLVLVLGLRRISHRIPGALIAVVGFILVSWLGNLSSYGIAALGTVPGGLPGITPPNIDLSLTPQLVNISLAMFAVILAQSAATSRAYAAKHEERLSADAELVGLGFANLAAGLTGTFVVNGSPTKTQAVDSAGGRSQVSQLVMALIVTLVLLFLTGPLAFMPRAVLSTIVFIIGVELIDVTGFRRVLAARPDEFVVAVITAIVVVVAGVEQAIILAAILSLLDHVRRGYKPRNRLLVPAAPGHWRPLPVTTGEHAFPGLMIYRFNHSMYYANAQRFLDEVINLVNNDDKPVSWFCLDADAIDDVDFSAEAALLQIHKSLKDKRIRLVLAAVADDVRAEMDRSGVSAAMGEDTFYETLADVVTRYHTNGDDLTATTTTSR